MSRGRVAPRSSLATALLAVAMTLGALPAAGQQIFRYLAFGDSITRGRPDFDPTGQGGYPGRIDDLLNCFDPDCEVINEGKDGEQTAAAVTRIENLLDAERWDVVLLMEGTNDIFSNISNNTIESNLTLMDSKARDHGVDTLHASIIHFDPDSDGGMDPGMVADVADLRQRVIALAADRNRYFADPWTPLCPDQACFNAHYNNPGAGDPNTVGHPDASGYDLMADEFADVIASQPVPNLPPGVAPTGTINVSSPVFIWNKESPFVATWYQLRLLDADSNVLDETWYEEAICGISQCNVSLGSFPDGDYTWRVRARNPLGRSSWTTKVFTILTLLPPNLPLPEAPVGFIGDLEPLFTWRRETPASADSYQLEISDLGGIIFDMELTTASACTIDNCTADPFSGAPLAPGAYSWRIRGENAAGNGPWTDPLIFHVVPDLIFGDDFESGDFSFWSSVVL